MEAHALDVELAMVVEGVFAVLSNRWARRLVVELHFCRALSSKSVVGICVKKLMKLHFCQALHSYIASSCGYSNGGFIYLFIYSNYFCEEGPWFVSKVCAR